MVKGVAAHSGYPENGKSAVHLLLSILSDVLEHTWPSTSLFGTNCLVNGLKRHSMFVGKTTLNVAPISGGVASNVLAESASAFVTFRVSTSCEETLDILKSIVRDRALIEVRHTSAPLLHSSESLTKNTTSRVSLAYQFFNIFDSRATGAIREQAHGVQHGHPGLRKPQPPQRSVSLRRWIDHQRTFGEGIRCRQGLGKGHRRLRRLNAEVAQAVGAVLPKFLTNMLLFLCRSYQR